MIAFLLITGGVVAAVVIVRQNSSLERNIAVSSITAHLDELYVIAQKNSANSRAVNWGYNDSAAYVMSQLEEQGGWCAPPFLPICTDTVLV